MKKCNTIVINYLLTGIIMYLQVANIVHAQDPVFSQPYMSPVYLNPAATGSAEKDLRISAMIRRQWWTIPSEFTYTAFSVDKFIPSLQSGIGLLVTTSSEGYIKKNGVYATYAYTFCPGVPDPGPKAELPKWFLTGAMQFGGAQRHVDYRNLLFADQIDVNGIIPGGVTGADVPVYNGRWYLDMGAGLIFNYRFTDYNRILFGISARHVNRPDESLTATNSANRSILPVLWSGNILYTNSTDEDWTYSVEANVSNQQQNHFLQLGFEVTQMKYNISVAARYRGNIDLKGTPNLKDPDAFTMSVSFNLSGANGSSKFKIGIAHDSPMGKEKYSHNGGSSEIGFVWEQQTYNTNNDNPCKPIISPEDACPENPR